MNTQTSLIRISSLSPQVIKIGEEATPIIIIDDFAEDLAPLLSFAHEAIFKQDNGSYYPGVRARLPKPYAIEVINQVFQLIYDVYRIPHHLRITPHIYSFSLITQTPESLQPLQCLPHFDTKESNYFAILHYLNSTPHGATAFFKHKPTGFERINSERIDEYFNKAQVCLDEIKCQTPQYFTHSNEHYEIYHQVEYRPNRLIIYPGNLLHSTLVDLDTDIDSKPETGRLTSNIFINFK
ncbi:DUF6445 family protein [Shewanella woodyi]|uniref:DUF6445 family protein n=1 Tax=Shewanella woodyi TaxID=60961 RepID=UPI0037497EF4